MGKKISLMIGAVQGTNINSSSKVFDRDGNGELPRVN